MIGSGIFIVSADIARTVGSPGWLLIVWLVAGLMTVVAALSYGELASMMPAAGGNMSTCGKRIIHWWDSCMAGLLSW